MRRVGGNMVLVPTLDPRVEQLVGNIYSERCAQCGRSVLTENRAGTGFLANCGRRLSSIAECRPEGCASVSGDQ